MTTITMPDGQMKTNFAGPRGLGQPLVLLLSLLVALGVWHWSDAILVPRYTLEAERRGRPIGNNSDLYPLWFGAREALLHHRNPYSAEVTRQIQMGFYGRALASENPSDPTDQQAFVYPLYVVFLLAPSVGMPFSTVQESSRWLLLLCVACSVPLWMHAIQLRAGWLLTVSAMVLAVSSFAAVYEYLQQNLTALILLFVAAAAAMVARNWLVLSGCLLALSSVKPQLSGLVILWFLLWALAGWKERQRLMWSFLATITVLLIAAERLSPHWMPEFLTAIGTYQHYGIDRAMALTVLPRLLGNLVNVAAAVALAFVCLYSRRASAGSPQFSWALAWVAVVTLAIIPKLAPHYHLLLIPVLLVMLSQRRAIWKMGAITRALTKATFACQLWQWLTALTLSLLSLAIPADRLRGAAEVPMYTLYALPMLALLAVVARTTSMRTTRSLGKVRD